MPFTASHIAAVVPLYPRLGRFRILSALAIGSMSPDLHYFLPIDIGRVSTHGAWGLIWFCLPMSVATYMLYHALVKHALIALLPEWIAARVNRIAGEPYALPNVRWIDVLGAIAIGAGTHIVWDAFTHRRGWGTALFPALRGYVVSVQGLDLYVYSLLQHASSGIGLALIAWWAWRWLRQAAPSHVEHRSRLSVRTKVLVWASISGAAAVNGVIAFAPYLESIDALRLGTLPAFTLTVSTIAGAAFALLVFAVAWRRHVLRWSLGGR
ncbi:MAG: DUF4184 family protein [Burkholderiales bacterium]